MLKPVGPLHAMSVIDGTATALCDAPGVRVIPGSEWPPSVAGPEGACAHCEELASGRP